MREALKLYVNLISFSISAGDFCPFVALDILIKMTAVQFMYYRRQSHKLRKSFVRRAPCCPNFVTDCDAAADASFTTLSECDLHLLTLKISWGNAAACDHILFNIIILYCKSYYY